VHKRRLESLERRLSSLSLQPALKRALIGSLRELGEGTHAGAVTGLQLLVAPARETLGAEAADAIALAARTAKETMQQREGAAS
jgi:hypothetical protein